MTCCLMCKKHRKLKSNKIGKLGLWGGVAGGAQRLFDAGERPLGG